MTLSLLAALTPATAQAQVRYGQGEGTKADKPMEFVVRIENVSTPMTLKLSNGKTAPAPTAPVLWIVHTEPDVLFTEGERDRGKGLEALAEDGNPDPLTKSLEGARGVAAVGAVNTPLGDKEAGPILPGKAYEFRVTAKPGETLTVAFMFGQSNDLFYAPNGSGIALFDAAGKPMSGDVTGRFLLWDAGTEVNEEPGLGADQAPRQKAPNTGAAENGRVRLVRDRFTYPKVREVIQVTLTPQETMMSGH
jgi:hypothetical protein